MKAIRWTHLAIAAAVTLCTAAGVQAQVKIGAVNLQKALQDTVEIKQAEADLKARFGPRQDELAQLEKETAKLQQEYDANQTKYNEATLAELGARLQLKQRQLQRNSEALQEAVQRNRQDILQRVGQRLQEVVKKVAEEKGLDMVVDGANLLYFKPAFDISAEVTSAYDKAYPGKK
ncbi:MAG: OmpH family outer membrane protein [Candidatus Solibacter usitatus]|nr:OmpH family outer membrane protein [Candidatus Solibacter usitatus]